MKINLKNTEKVEAALADVNGNAWSHCIRFASQVRTVADQAEKTLALPKKDMTGVEVFYTPAGPWARAYKYAAISTTIKLLRGASGWFLVSVERTSLYPETKERLDIIITSDQRDEIIRRRLGDFVVRSDERVRWEAA